jgi:hypothetical protein
MPINVNSAITAGIGASTVFAKNMSAASSIATTPGIMAGFGTASPVATVVTPNLSGIIEVAFSGVFTIASGAQTTTVQIAYSSGAVPNQGAAATGTLLGSSTVLRPAAISSTSPYDRIAVIGGLSLGVSYWFDIVYYTSSATYATSLSSTDCIIEELLW